MSDVDDFISEEQDPALIAEFVSESVQGLQEIESDLLTLESEGTSDAELVNRIFRTVHTIKGSGGYLKLSSLVSVAHRAETLLDNIRFGTQDPTPVVTDAILAAIDTIKQMLETADMGASMDFQSTLQKLDGVLGTNEKSVAPTNSKANPQQDTGNADCLTEEDIDRIQAGTSGKAFVFRIEVNLESIQQVVDVKEGLVAAFTSIGKVLHANKPEEEINRAVSGACIVYLETVLEKPILCDYFCFEPSSVTEIDVTKLKPSAPSSTNSNAANSNAATNNAATNKASTKNSATSAGTGTNQVTTIAATNRQPLMRAASQMLARAMPRAM